VKKFISLLLTLAMICVPFISYAGGSLTQTGTNVFKCYGDKSEVCVWTLTWTGSSVDGNFTSTALDTTTVDKVRAHYLTIVDTDNSTTAPTTGYDITLTNARGMDILGGVATNRTSNVPERVFVETDNTTSYTPIGDEVLTLNISGNSVASATGIIKFWFFK